MRRAAGAAGAAASVASARVNPTSVDLCIVTSSPGGRVLVAGLPRHDNRWDRNIRDFRRNFAYSARVLTRRQKQVLDFVAAQIERHGVAPTLHEIGRHLKVSSVATVHKHVRSLEEKGAIRRLTHRSRALALVPDPDVAAGARIPLLGTVAAGTPIEPIEVADTIAVPEELLGRGETFALRVRGDSMIDDGIRDGDVIVVEARREARDGATVVALVRGEATVKKLHRRRGQVHLVPANERMAPIVARADEVEIRGVVVGLVRRYR